MDARVRLTVRLINERDFSVAFTLHELCGWLGLSEPYLLRLFHREVGKTLRQHMLEVRMRKAADLLKDPSKPIKSIALECGYTDISNFYRDFKSCYSLTPKEFKLRALSGVDHYVQTSTLKFPQQNTN